MATVQNTAGEARDRVRYAPIAMLGGALLIVSAVIQLGGVHAKVNEVTLGLITVSRRGWIDVIGAIVNGVALALIAAALNFLYRLVKARQPGVGGYLRILAIAAGLVTGILGIAYSIVVHVTWHQFVTQRTQTYVQPSRLTHAFV